MECLIECRTNQVRHTCIKNSKLLISTLLYIQNLCNKRTYDVVGPICESSDVFGKAVDLNGVKRGDLIALRSAGAYGEIMASGYNCRELPQGYTSDELV